MLFPPGCWDKQQRGGRGGLGNGIQRSKTSLGAGKPGGLGKLYSQVQPNAWIKDQALRARRPGRTLTLRALEHLGHDSRDWD